MTTAESRVSERVSVNPLGAAIRADIASTAPPAPAQAALTTNARMRARPRSIPASSAATSSSRTARQRRPIRLDEAFANRKNTITSSIQLT